MNLVIIVIVATATEFTSNTATAQLLLPVLRDMVGIVKYKARVTYKYLFIRQSQMNHKL